MTFGENLKALRTARAVSQKELAEELGFSFQNISKWERNESLPDINTLIDIAKFFESTVDGLLGYTLDEKVSTLKLRADEVTVFAAYPEKEERLTDHMILVIDRDGKLTGSFYVAPHIRRYQDGYIRDHYDLYDDNSTLLFGYVLWDNDSQTKRQTHNKVRIPEGGFAIAVPTASYAQKKIMSFITPGEYSAWLDQDRYADYYDSRTGRYLLSDVIKHNELDHITVTVALPDGGLIFKKPAEAVDPLSVQVEVLARIVRRELEKEHNKQIEELKREIEDLSDTVDDYESQISDLDERVVELESKIAELEAKLGEEGGTDEE